MKKLNYFAIAIGFLSTLITMVLYGFDYYMAFLMLLIFIHLLSSKHVKSSRVYSLISVIVTSYGISIYNILYIVLKNNGKVDLGVVEWKLLVQLIIPLAIGLIIQVIYINYNKNKGKYKRGGRLIRR